MLPDAREWQTSSTYDFMDEIGVDDLAWECLRRNRDYQKDFAGTLARGPAGSDKSETIGHRWGLRFRRPAKPERARSACILDA
ncbi:transcriptional regulator domain-containing protein [Mesorhizobium retamae]|uniref:DUF6499 domain-containing protein n=1 Tax=Mesorhizobium retamae TaxID=2912854 RepID=A0ABS9QKA5_9HYPH|nr:DUF6499 domain-containing protein [Mesorhizobium sp. IRAMC:0171]MCG7507865.1 DUF6499 domain-containing protein [Mesorhizobium sp. IRAMC:0171]